MVDLRVFVFVGVYSSREAAQADYEALRDAHAEGMIGTYDAANVFKDAEGRVYVHKHEKPTQHGTWTGAAVGALLGVLFPPSIEADGDRARARVDILEVRISCQPAFGQTCAEDCGSSSP